MSDFEPIPNQHEHTLWSPQCNYVYALLGKSTLVNDFFDRGNTWLSAELFLSFEVIPSPDTMSSSVTVWMVRGNAAKSGTAPPFSRTLPVAVGATFVPSFSASTTCRTCNH